MSTRIVFLASALLVLGLLLLLRIWFRHDPEQRNFEVFTEMMYSPGYESFSQSSVFENGMTQQELVAGVVPRGREEFPYGDGPEEAARAGVDWQNPIAVDDRAASTRGKELYGIYCQVCHDAKGEGRGRAVLRGVVPPPSLHAARAMEMADGEMFHILTRGQGNMASYAAQLTPTERWSVIRHVRELQQRFSASGNSSEGGE